jgi:hypothetical protein
VGAIIINQISKYKKIANKAPKRAQKTRIIRKKEEKPKYTKSNVLFY